MATTSISVRYSTVEDAMHELQIVAAVAAEAAIPVDTTVVESLEQAMHELRIMAAEVAAIPVATISFADYKNLITDFNDRYARHNDILAHYNNLHTTNENGCKAAMNDPEGAPFITLMSIADNKNLLDDYKNILNHYNTIIALMSRIADNKKILIDNNDNLAADDFIRLIVTSRIDDYKNLISDINDYLAAKDAARITAKEKAVRNTAKE